MIRLWNTHTKDWLNLVGEQTFSIQAHNQLQNLDKYDISYSFDISLVNDENSRDASLYEYYASGGTQKMVFLGIEIEVPVTKLPKVILYYDNTPLYIGRLMILETTMTAIKCVYKCVPYGRCFNDFDMRPKLKDYFEHGVHTGTQFRTLLDPKNLEIRGSDRNPHKATWPSMHVEFPNSSDDVLNPGDTFDACCCIKNLENNKYVQYIHNTAGHDSALQYWCLSPIDELLECMNISTFFPNYDRMIAFPMNISYKRTIKVRCYRSEIIANHVKFKPMETSEIWWLNDSTHQWELLNECVFRGITTQAFQESLRKCRGLDGLKLKTIEYPIMPDETVYEQKGILTLSTNNGYKSIDFGIETDHTYKDGEDTTLELIGTNLHLQSLAQYVDVVYELECNFGEKDASSKTKESLWATVPCMKYDFGFLDMSTTEFLNQLSLNNTDYEWLRNPSFWSSENQFQVHGIMPDNVFRVPQICKLNNNNIEKITKTVDYEAPSSVEIHTPTGFETICVKKLNNNGNEPKKIDMSCTSLGWTGLNLGVSDPGLGSGVTTTGFNPPKGLKRGTPPLVRDEHDGNILGSDLKGCFGQVSRFTMHHRGGVRYTQIWWFLTNNDFNYLEDYCDTTNKYHITVLGGVDNGYFMQQYVQYENRTFIVESFKTNDFKKFDLVCYEKTDWVHHEPYEKPKYSVASQTIIIGGADPRDPASSRNEFYPDGRPVNRR